ncbi:hypothetical protein BTO04_07885 [Polaribacter sp. SA4-10]|uniref:T9SS type A sorting domain-containing protein n=1 Tax=Polaribacter sp. SA4-10 TaxID=754397 RepID=UPI000B3C92E6|nr:T9SS type A sorting domain-containing protein [Polaribacter sp. SA4-10]ARV06620.1 hypothetical protein BTO04_07885 [Polaribacter sp. SA4-10]
MKKITLLFTLFLATIGFSQTLPLDFSDASQAFQWDASGGTGGDAIINTTSEKLEIFGNGNAWDNAFITFSGTDVVDLSNDAANTITFTIQSTTASAGEVHTHLMKLTGAGVYETDFTTTGQEVKTVFINPPALGDLTELRIFVDKGSADGGTYLVDDISLFADAEAPTAFTATVGTIGAYGVELLLNATDNSGSVTYDISYNGGANTVQTTGTSGVEKSFTVSGLTPETAYSFEVSASDGTGNVAANNPITGLDATTIADTSNECEGFTSEALEGSFSVGINYSFVTSGTDVTITFEMLDTDKPGLNPEVYIEPSTFIAMDQSNAPTYTATLTDQTPEADISFSFRAAYAGGLVRSKIFTYTVGEDCGGSSVDTTLEDATLSNLTVSDTTVSGFSAGTLTYDIELAYGTVAVPTVVGTPTQSAPANAVTTDAAALPGTSTVLVTAKDGTTTKTYTLNFTVAGPSVTLPLDFSDASQAFQWDASGGTGGDAIINTTSEKLEIFGNGNAWDNAFITFSGTDVVDLSNDAANTITFTIQSTTASAGEVHTHLMKLTGAGVYETDFTTTGQEVKTVFINPPALGDLTELRIFVDKGSADGGTYLVDDISLFADAEAPTAFTATVGTIGAYGVELLLNATDNSGSVTYDISYNGGANTVQTTGTSGVEKSFTVSGLTPETAYSFEVSASDGTGNVAANNPITGLDATTIADTSNECEGFTSEALEGSFSVGINYSFVTSGTDVTITFEMLDTDKPGLNPEVYIEPSTFIAMDQSNAPTYTATLADQTPGADISFSFRAAYAGGLVRSKIFTYTVGEDCGTLGTNDFDLASFSAYPNPTQNSWTVKTQNVNMSSIKVYDVLGKNVLSLSPNSSETVIDGSNLKTGLYFAQIKTEKGVQRIKLVKN